MSVRGVPLVLVGPMGAGKSSVGRVLATRLGLPFIDMDRVIEARTHKTVAAIFADEGEAAFRRLETIVLGNLLHGPRAVIASGGGVVLRAENRILLRQQATVLHLQASVDAQLQRLQDDATRPLLQRADRRDALIAMAVERAPLYVDVADGCIDTSTLDIAACCEAALAWLSTRPEIHA